MTQHYFTFGFGQGHDNCYTVIDADDALTAREEMFRRWGQKWSMQYRSADEAGVKEFGLRRIQ